MIRVALTLVALLAPVGPAHAWEAGVEGSICTLTHAEGAAVVRLTYDPAGPLYTITATRPDPWPQSAIFGIAFLDGDELTITTDRHSLSEDARTITVADRGFGNVLFGLSQNSTARFFAGAATLEVMLDGAAPEVATFEACEIRPSA